LNSVLRRFLTRVQQSHRPMSIPRWRLIRKRLLLPERNWIQTALSRTFLESHGLA